MAVLFQTTVGELTVDLYAEDAPYSSFNFLKLCKAKYYNNVAFHRVEKNFLASTGSPLTADARWNVAGLGGVSADFRKFGKTNNNPVDVGNSDTAKDVESRGGCSIWGVQALAAEKRVTLRRLDARISQPKVKGEDEHTISGCKNIKNEPNSETSTSPASPSPGALTGRKPCSLQPAGHDQTKERTCAADIQSSMPSAISSSTSSFVLSSSSSNSNSSAASASSDPSRAPQGKSKVRKSGWDPVDPATTSAGNGPSYSQQTSYFSSIDLSSIAFPAFPAHPVLNPPFPMRPPLRTPSSARYCPSEPSPINDTRRKHGVKGAVGWIPSVISGNYMDNGMLQQTVGLSTAEEHRARMQGEITSLFYITLRESIDFLDKRNLTLFGRVTEGLDVLEKINQTFVDERFVPLTPVRILHTYVLDDPFSYDPPVLLPAPESPLPLVEEVLSDEDDVQDEVLLLEKVERKEAEARKVTLEILGDLPSADVKPPDNVLFVAQLNPVTEDDDLRTVFSRFGEILSCDVIRDWKTKQSLQYAFITFADKSACELAYFKMQNVLIDDRRIHVDFSQSVARTWQQYKQSGRFQQEQPQQQQQQQQQQQVQGKGFGSAAGAGSRGGRSSRGMHAEIERAAAAAAAAAKNAGVPQELRAHTTATCAQRSLQQQEEHHHRQQRKGLPDNRRDGAAGFRDGGMRDGGSCSGFQSSNTLHVSDRTREGAFVFRGDGSRDREGSSSGAALARPEREEAWRNSRSSDKGMARAVYRDGAAERRSTEARRRRGSSSTSSRRSSRSRSRGTRKKKKASTESHKAERRRWKKKKRERSSSSSSEFSDSSDGRESRQGSSRTKKSEAKVKRKNKKRHG